MAGQRGMPARAHGAAVHPGRPAGPGMERQTGLGRALPADKLAAAGLGELAPVMHEEAA